MYQKKRFTINRVLSLFMTLIMLLGSISINTISAFASIDDSYSFDNNYIFDEWDFDEWDFDEWDFDEWDFDEDGFIGFEPFSLGSVLVLIDPNGGRYGTSTEPFRFNANPGDLIPDPSALLNHPTSGAELLGFTSTAISGNRNWLFSQDTIPDSPQVILVAQWYIPREIGVVRPTQDIQFRRFDIYRGDGWNPNPEIITRVATQGGTNAAVPNNLAALPATAPGANMHGATGGAAFTGWYSRAAGGVHGDRLSSIAFLSGASNPRTVDVMARYQRTIVFNRHGGSQRVSYFLDAPNDRLYDSPLMPANVMVPANIYLYEGSEHYITINAWHEFLGWFDENGNDFTRQVEDGLVTGMNFPANGTLNLTARYRLIEADTRQVTIVYNNGIEPAQRTFRIPYDPERSAPSLNYIPHVPNGMAFAGWQRRNNGNFAPANTVTPTPLISEDNLTFVARYDFIIEFRLNGATLGNQPDRTQFRARVQYPTPQDISQARSYNTFDQYFSIWGIPNNAIPTMPNNSEFRGWFSNVKHTYIDVDALITTSQQLIALRRSGGTRINLITYNFQGGGPNTVPHGQYAIVGEAFYNIANPEPTRRGFTFNGWWDAPTGGNRIVFANEEGPHTLVPEGGLTIHAQWLVNYRLEFRVDNIVVDFHHLVEGEYLNFFDPETGQINNFLEIPTHEFSRFVRWDFFNHQGTTRLNSWDGASPLQANSENFRGAALPATGTNVPIIFHAIWEPNPTVTFIYNDGSGRENTIYTRYIDGEFIFEYPNATTRGHAFIGWNTCSGFTLVPNTEECEYCVDLADYEDCRYCVDYIVVRCGDDCEGIWFTSGTAVEDVENIRLYGRWEQGPIAITFVAPALAPWNSETKVEFANVQGQVFPPAFQTITIELLEQTIGIGEWFDNPNRTGFPINFNEFFPTEDMRLYGASRTLNYFTVTFRSAFDNVIGEVNIPAGELFTRAHAPAIPYDSRYFFQNDWFPRRDWWYENTDIEPWLFGVPINTNITLWAAGAHRVSFYATDTLRLPIPGNDDADPHQILVLRGDTLPVNLNNWLGNPTVPAEKANYEFLGWFINGEAARPWNIGDPILEHTRLVAGWEERIINDTPTLEISNAEGMAGEIIEVIVSLHNNAGTNMFSINFDLGPYGHYLEFLGATSLIQDPFSFFNYSGTPLLGTRWMSGVPTEQTELFALRFRIDPNVSVDYIPIFFDTADNNITSLNFVSISSLVELGQLELNDGSTGEFGIISILPALPLPQPILTINSANERIRPLDSVFIELSLEENLGVAVIEFDLNFDSDVLEFVDFTSDSAGTGTFDSNIVRWEADENATFESLFTMEFIVPNNAFDSAINTTVVVNTIQALDISGEEIPIGLPIFANNNAEVDVYVFWGDVNFAGEAPNIFSANTLMNYITGMPGILIDRRAANVDWTPNINGDQVLDMADAMTLFNYALGLPMIPSLPHNTHLARTRLAQEVAWNSPADIKSVINPTDTPNEFELSVHISNNPGIAAYHLMLEFDNNIITPISIAQGDDFNNSIFVSNLAWVENSIKTTWLSETINYNDGVLFTVLFRTDDIANLSNIMLSAIDVLSYDLANRFRVINVVTNINPTPFVMEIDHVDIVNDEDYKEDKESSEEYSNIEYSTYQEYVVQPQ